MMKLGNLCEIIKKLESTLDIQDLIVLIDKEEPKEVIHKKAPYGYPFNTGNCPVCYHELEEHDQYCSSCGQHVSW